MDSMARIYQGYKCASYDINAEIKLLWIWNISVISTKTIVIVLQIHTLNTSTLKNFTFTLYSYRVHKLNKYE